MISPHPWTIKPDLYGDVDERGVTATWDIHSADDLKVATVWGREYQDKDDYCPPNRDAETNARLLRAAPELLDQLYQLVESGIFADAASVSPWLRARRDEARKLIARIDNRRTIG